MGNWQHVHGHKHLIREADCMNDSCGSRAWERRPSRKASYATGVCTRCGMTWKVEHLAP